MTEKPLPLTELWMVPFHVPACWIALDADAALWYDGLVLKGLDCAFVFVRVSNARVLQVPGSLMSSHVYS